MKSTLMLLALGSFSFLGAAEGEEKAPECPKCPLFFMDFKSAVATRNYCETKAHLDYILKDIKEEAAARAETSVDVDDVARSINGLVDVQQEKILAKWAVLSQFDRQPGCTGVSDRLIKKLFFDAWNQLDSKKIAKEAIASAEMAEILRARVKAIEFADRSAEVRFRGSGEEIVSDLRYDITEQAVPNCAGIKAFFELNKDMNKRMAAAAIGHFKSRGINCDYDSLLPEGAKK